MERNNSADCIRVSDTIVLFDALPIIRPVTLVSPTTLRVEPLNVRLFSTVAFGAEPFNVIIPLSVVPVRESKPDVPEVPVVPLVPEVPVVPLVPEVPEVPFTPLVPFTTPTEVIT